MCELILIKRMIRDLVESFSECSDGSEALNAYAAQG
jgi:hypothetical protein